MVPLRPLLLLSLLLPTLPFLQPLNTRPLPCLTCSPLSSLSTPTPPPPTTNSTRPPSPPKPSPSTKPSKSPPTIQRTALLDSLSYEADLLQTWEESDQRGFDYFLEKLRRSFSNLSFADGRASRGGRDWTFSPARTPPLLPIQRRPLTPLDALKPALHALTRREVPIAEIEMPRGGSALGFITGVLGGDLQTLAGGPLFLLLAKYCQKNGPVYTLAFGPKSFLIVSDPCMARHVLQSRPDAYSKGVLEEILKPIMGNGLIPADPATWKVRRRAIVPGFHRRWLGRMVSLFSGAAAELLGSVDAAAAAGSPLEMEERFCSVSLDIIGRAVFNYDFGSVRAESPVVKAVYRILREAEHRSTSFIP